MPGKGITLDEDKIKPFISEDGTIVICGLCTGSNPCDCELQYLKKQPTLKKEILADTMGIKLGTPPRIIPTHFMEVWKTTTGHIVIDNAKPISILDMCLKATKGISSGLAETIALFKIKLKQ